MDVAEERREIPGAESVSDKRKQATASEPLKDGDGETSLGKLLANARERRGLSREDAITETRIPDHYLRMMESNDYSMISDQLYLLPFLRKYAVFLQLDPEEIGMRFVREVQRADNNPPPVRLAEPLDKVHRRKRHNWTGIIVVIGLLAVIVGAYIAESRHNDSGDSSAPATAIAPANGAANTPMIKPVAPVPAIGGLPAPSSARPQ